MPRRLLALLLLLGLLGVGWVALLPHAEKAHTGRAAPLSSARRPGESEASDLHDECAPFATASVTGVVRGKNGPLSGVEIFADPMEEGMSEGSGGSGIDGTYRLELQAPGDYRLTITPQRGAGLLVTTRIVRGLQPGESRVLDIDFAGFPYTSGRLDPPANASLFAVSAADFEAVPADAPDAHARLRLQRRAEAVGSEQGTFTFNDLPPGEYYLVLDTPNVVLRAPVAFHAGEQDVRAEVDGVYSAELLAVDIETDMRVGEFRFEVTGDRGRRLGESDYRGGRPEHPLIYSIPLSPAWGVLSARGYVEVEMPLEAFEGSQPIWLCPDRIAPTLLARVRYPDGRDVGGELSYSVRREDRYCSGPLTLFMDGSRIGRLPVGTWHLTVGRGNSVQAQVERESVVIIGYGTKTLDLPFPQGGRLALEGIGTDECEVILSRADDHTRWLSRRIPPGSRSFEDLPEGRYDCQVRAGDPGRQWNREFTITGTETVVLDFGR